MTAPDAEEHCRKAFGTPAHLPFLDSPESVAELLTSIQFFTGENCMKNNVFFFSISPDFTAIYRNQCMSNIKNI